MPNALETFDKCWCDYEDLYVRELMAIETRSRRFIVEAIDAEI